MYQFEIHLQSTTGIFFPPEKVIGWGIFIVDGKTVIKDDFGLILCVVPDSALVIKKQLPKQPEPIQPS